MILFINQQDDVSIIHSAFQNIYDWLRIRGIRC